MVANFPISGQFLAVGWSDGVVRLMGLENNKAAHHIPVCETSDAAITHIGWATGAITDKSPKLPSTIFQDSSLSNEWTTRGEEAPVNLPLELTFLEVDSALPKISPLPASSAGSG